PAGVRQLPARLALALGPGALAHQPTHRVLLARTGAGLVERAEGLRLQEQAGLAAGPAQVEGDELRPVFHRAVDDPGGADRHRVVSLRPRLLGLAAGVVP